MVFSVYLHNLSIDVLTQHNYMTKSNKKRVYSAILVLSRVILAKSRPVNPPLRFVQCCQNKGCEIYSLLLS